MSVDLHILVGAFALDALDSVERDQFESHLESCDSCRLEAAELSATAARLGSVVELHPSPAMRARVMDAISRTPQQRPIVVPMRERRAPQPTPTSRWTSRGLAVAAAVLAVVGAGVAVDQYQDSQSQNASVAEQEKARIADVLAADDKVTYDRETDAGLHLNVITSREADAAVVTLRDLPALPENRSYQMWRIVDGKPHSARVMDADDLNRDTVTVFMDDAADAEAVAITEEPAGGSQQPTTKPLVAVNIGT